MSPTTDEVDGTWAVFVTKQWPFSKIEVMQEINSWGPGGGREEFEYALENGMIELNPKWREHGGRVYRPTAKGLHLLKNPGSKECSCKDALDAPLPKSVVQAKGQAGSLV